MELDSMRAFVLAVQLGSVTAAARALALSQPAVTTRLKGLERDAGELLLVRGRRGVRPTRAGEIFYARAQQVLKSIDELQAELRASGSLRRGTLRIGATDVMAVYYLPRVLMRVKRRYPGIQVEVQVEGSRRLSERVRSGDLDLALVTLPVEHPELETSEIHRERIEMVASQEHRLARRRRVGLGELAREPLIEHRRDSVTREMVDAVFRVHGFEPHVAMEVSSPEAMKQLVALGLGIAPLSRSLIAEEIAQGRLVRLRVPEFRCWRRSGIIRRSQAPALRVVSAFLALLPRNSGRRAAPRQ
jgi:DNA-binding transcriptional LysR family regulator